jgi:hypothetical protein
MAQSNCAANSPPMMISIMLMLGMLMATLGQTGLSLSLSLSLSIYIYINVCVCKTNIDLLFNVMKVPKLVFVMEGLGTTYHNHLKL